MNDEYIYLAGIRFSPHNHVLPARVPVVWIFYHILEEGVGATRVDTAVIVHRMQPSAVSEFLASCLVVEWLRLREVQYVNEFLNNILKSPCNSIC